VHRYLDQENEFTIEMLQDRFPLFGLLQKPPLISDESKTLIVVQACVNRTAYLVNHDTESNLLPQPLIIGNKTAVFHVLLR